VLMNKEADSMNANCPKHYVRIAELRALTPASENGGAVVRSCAGRTSEGIRLRLAHLRSTSCK